jgi:hypothetical protein
MEEKFNLINDSFGQQLMDNSFDNELKTNDNVSPKIYLGLSDSQVLVKYLRHL